MRVKIFRKTTAGRGPLLDGEGPACGCVKCALYYSLLMDAYHAWGIIRINLFILSS